MTIVVARTTIASRRKMPPKKVVVDGKEATLKLN